MTAYELDGIMVTSEPNLEYLSEFVTQFAWASAVFGGRSAAGLARLAIYRASTMCIRG